MIQWLKENWDKLLGLIVSIVIAGVIGFFSAIRATESQIAGLRSRIVALETDSENLIKPKLEVVDATKLDVVRIVGRLDSFERENDIYKATYNLIELKREEEKRRTINELQEMLKH